MKKFLSALAWGVLVSVPAVAADIAAAPPAYKVSEAGWSWVGPYLGGSVGGTWDRSDVGVTPSPQWLTSGIASDAAGAAIDSTNGPDRINLRGLTGGLQAGLNSQSGAAIFGLEGDFSYLGLKKSLSRGPFLNAVNGGFVSFNESTQTNWLGTFRVRLGYLITPQILFFATGGLAFGDRNFSDARTTSISVQTYAGSATSAKTGTVVGAGVEGYLGGNWTAKAEYLYVDLGHVMAVGPAVAPVNPLYFINYTERLTENIVRLGVNYHFNGLAGAYY
jgi:outer membrane immunogenic protein